MATMRYLVAQLRTAGATFRNESISGPGHQVLIGAPSGIPVEIFGSR